MPVHDFLTSGTQLSRSRVLSIPEDVVYALESDLAVEDPDGPVEVFAMTDDAPEELEGRPVMGRRVVLVPQSADGTPRSHFTDSNSVEADKVSTLQAVGFTAPESLAGQASVHPVMGSEVAGQLRSWRVVIRADHPLVQGQISNGHPIQKVWSLRSRKLRTMIREPLRRVKIW